MKQLKRCDGYVLPYVLVVFLLLSAVAVSICATSLNNLKAQEAAVERSKALYEAEGEVEKSVAKVLNHSINETRSDKAALRDLFMEEAEDLVGQEDSGTPDAADNVFTLKLDVAVADVHIESVVQVELDIEYSHSETEGEEPNTRTVDYYKVSGVALTYDSYDISYTGGAA